MRINIQNWQIEPFCNSPKSMIGKPFIHNNKLFILYEDYSVYYYDQGRVSFFAKLIFLFVAKLTFSKNIFVLFADTLQEFPTFLKPIAKKNFALVHYKNSIILFGGRTETHVIIPFKSTTLHLKCLNCRVCFFCGRYLPNSLSYICPLPEYWTRHNSQLIF